jgi:GntR family transcriptional regulator/MocR family aminotransferase
LARFIEHGDHDRHLRRCQRAYKERRDALVAALDECLPGTEVSGIAAGLHAIATLPGRYGPQDSLLRRLAASGVAVRPLSHYGDGTVGDGVPLVLGYAHLTPARIAEGVRLLARAAGQGGA